MTQITAATLYYLPLAYLFGTFPSGRLIAQVQGVNIAKHGSGNVGATNVARVLGKKAGIATLVLDICKGFLAVYLGTLLAPSIAPVLIGLFAVLGHCFSLPPFLKGGKGVATSFGVLLAISPQLALVALLSFFVCFALTRIVSAASIAAATSAALTALFISNSVDKAFGYGCVAIACVIIMRHHQNISRLMRGVEPKFGK